MVRFFATPLVRIVLAIMVLALAAVACRYATTGQPTTIDLWPFDNRSVATQAPVAQPVTDAVGTTVPQGMDPCPPSEAGASLRSSSYNSSMGTRMCTYDPTPGASTVASIPTPSVTTVDSFCPQAADLGPWAPGGVGETFEVTCNETVCSGTHVQLWWPGGSHQDWEKQEISVIIPPGLSIEVQQGAGRGWEYSLGCSMADIESQVAADNVRRGTDTSFFGQVDIDQLIETGLVKVRFDRRANPTK